MLPVPWPEYRLIWFVGTYYVLPISRSSGILLVYHSYILLTISVTSSNQSKQLTFTNYCPLPSFLTINVQLSQCWEILKSNISPDWQNKDSVILGKYQWTFPRVLLFCAEHFPGLQSIYCCQSQSTRGNVHIYSNIKGCQHCAVLPTCPYWL